VTGANDDGEGGRLPPERVTGVGGIYFRGRDPRALAAWYRDRLGVPLDPSGAFAPFGVTLGTRCGVHRGRIPRRHHRILLMTRVRR
jgi:hypothetical protein